MQLCEPVGLTPSLIFLFFHVLNSQLLLEFTLTVPISPFLYICLFVFVCVIRWCAASVDNPVKSHWSGNAPTSTLDSFPLLDLIMSVCWGWEVHEKSLPRCSFCCDFSAPLSTVHWTLRVSRVETHSWVCGWIILDKFAAPPLEDCITKQAVFNYMLSLSGYLNTVKLRGQRIFMFCWK